MPKYRINKAFIELRYRDSLLFNDMNNLQGIIEELGDVVTNYNFDSVSRAFILVNEDRKLNVTILNNRIVIDQDEPTSLEEFKNIANNILRKIIERLSISSFLRVGMRTYRGIVVNNINEANTYVRKNYIKINDNDFKLFGEPKNIKVNFSAIHNDYIVSLAINPHQFNVIEYQDGQLIRNVNESQVLIDTDIFIEKQVESSKVIDTFISDAINITEENVDKFIGKVNVY